MDQRPGGILPSNIDQLEAAESPQRRPRRNLVVPILCLLIAAGLGALVMLLFTSSRAPAPRPVAQATSAPAATSLPTPAAQQAPAQQSTGQQSTGQQTPAQRQPRAVSAPMPINGI